jgi:hypothetical protein
MGSGGTGPRILDLAIEWSGQLRVLTTLNPVTSGQEKSG